VIVPSESEALADTTDLTSLIVVTQDEALGQTQDLSTFLLTQENWARISPGLSGITYNQPGTSIVAGAQVLVFRDSDNVLQADLVGDGSGAWSSVLNSTYSYWISYWHAGLPARGYRTDKGINTVNTIVEIGNDGYVGSPGADSYSLGALSSPNKDTNGYLHPFGPDAGGGGTTIVKKLYLFDD